MSILVTTRPIYSWNEVGPLLWEIQGKTQLSVGRWIVPTKLEEGECRLCEAPVTLVYEDCLSPHLVDLVQVNGELRGYIHQCDRYNEHIRNSIKQAFEELGGVDTFMKWVEGRHE